uniref:BTB and MATH domain-containing protein 43 n=1 Tax=Lygus hesperus TaxID=30085 RepID=A0A0K8S5H1_LYGHE
MASETGDLKAEFSFVYTWEIKNFSSLSTIAGDFIKSPIFSGGVGNRRQAIFFLRLFPNGNREESEGYLSLYLEGLKNSKAFKTGNTVHMELSLLNVTYEEVETTRLTTSHVYTEEAPDWGYSTFISRNKVMAPNSELLSNDTLKVRCKLKGPRFKTQVKPPVYPTGDQVLKSKLVQGFWQQYLDQQCVDVVVVVQEKEFKVHKAVLAAHGPVFAAMFKVDMLESEQNRVTVKDCEHHVFEAFIKWLYLGEVDEVEQVNYELLALADQYQIDKLKVMCERSLSAKISVNNAIKILHLADLHRATSLKSKSLEFIKTRVPEISTSEDWPSLVNDPKLCEEVMLELASLVKTQL